jgi:cytoskeletal protein CcmA (bactofilin family)
VNAWIGQRVTIEGRIRSAQDLRIDGRVDGTIEVPQHEVVLGAAAEVKANVSARSVLIAGTLTGDVTATERLQIQATGSVEGNVTAPRLIVLDGAIVLGKVNVEGTPRAS